MTDDTDGDGHCQDCREQGYIDGSESRADEIAELKADLENEKEKNWDQKSEIDTLRDIIKKIYYLADRA